MLVCWKFANESILQDLFVILVISRCGIFNGQTGLPQYPHTNITTHTPSPISPSLSVPLSASHTHCCTVSPLPLQSAVQTSYTRVQWAVGRRNHSSAELLSTVNSFIPVFFFLFLYHSSVLALFVYPSLLPLYKTCWCYSHLSFKGCWCTFVV